jgi:hypothetical protein
VPAVQLNLADTLAATRCQGRERTMYQKHLIAYLLSHMYDTCLLLCAHSLPTWCRHKWWWPGLYPMWRWNLLPRWPQPLRAVPSGTHNNRACIQRLW